MSPDDKIDEVLKAVHKIDKRVVVIETRLLSLLEWRVAIVSAICGGLASIVTSLL